MQLQTFRRLVGSLPAACLLGNFTRDRRGLSAIEFALILPVLLMIYLMSVDITMILTADRRVTLIASSIGDLVGQATQISDDEMEDIFEVASAIIQPMPTANLSMVITSVVADGSGTTRVAWSDGHHATGSTPGTAFTLPDGIIAPNESVIVSNVTYTYSSPAAQFLTGAPITFDEVFYLRPRRTTQVARVN